MCALWALKALKSLGVTFREALRSERVQPLVSAWDLLYVSDAQRKDVWRDIRGSKSDFIAHCQSFADEYGVSLEGFRLPDNIRYAAEEPGVTHHIEELSH